MDEIAGATDAISNGRLQLGIGGDSPESVRDGQHQFGYDLEPGNSWANETRLRAPRLHAAIAGKGMNLLSSTLLLQDDGRPFHVLQADQLRQY